MSRGFWAAIFVLATLSILALFAAGPLVNRVRAFRAVQERFDRVDLSDGIQTDEADLIVSEYSSLVLGPAGTCSGTTQPVLADGAWRAEILFGFGGERTGHWIAVDPVRGGVASAGESSYADFGSFRRARLTRAVIYGR
jgi:hypothetical protein